MAELDYGKEKMDQYRRSADRVGEPLPVLELGLGGALSAALVERTSLAVSAVRGPRSEHPSSA